MNKDNVLIVYFSGTGSTKRIVEVFEKTLNERQYNTIVYPLDLSVQKLTSNECNEIIKKANMLFVVYPVYAFDAPKPIYDWINEIPLGNDIPTVVVSVSGGGIVWPNTLCRLSCIKALEEKNYKVFYEEMLVMPSNFVISTNDDLSMWLLKKMPDKVNKIVEDVSIGKVHRTTRKTNSGFISLISKKENKYSRLFGLSLMTNESCTGCGWCANNCPRNNIKIEEGKPVFLDQCIICMRCIYGCPTKAIYNKKYKFIAIKDGYSIKNIEKRMNGKELKPINECSKGLLWSGVKKYLLEKER